MIDDGVYRCAANVLLPHVNDETVQLVWTDPPYGTGNTQRLQSTQIAYTDDLPAVNILLNIGSDLKRIITPSGVIVICLDYRWVHETVVALKKIGLIFQGEIIWGFELGGVRKSWWSNKHNTLIMFSKTDHPHFNYDHVPTTIRKAGSYGVLGTEKKVTSVWQHTMSNSDAQRVGYPSQKPLEIIDPFIRVHTNSGDLVVDPFGGSGSTGVAALRAGRRFITCDTSDDAIKVMKMRFADEGVS